MNAKLGETTKMPLRNVTVDGVFINVYLKAAAVNVTLNALTDFFSKEISLKATLNRNKKNIQVMGENLELLGIYSSLNYGINNWYKGNVITYKDVAVKEEVLLTLFVPFGGPINIKGDDNMTIEVTVGRGVFSTDIDDGVSYIEFDIHNCIGYETGTPITRSYVVTAGITQDRYSFGDNVTKLAFIQLDKDNLSENVITTMNINSLQLDQHLNFYSALNNHWNNLVSPTVNYRYGATQPFTVAAPGTSAQPFLPAYPQSVILFAGTKDVKNYLDNCSVSAQFNAANVTAGKNYFMATSLEVTLELLEKAQERAVKHSEEKTERVPVQ